jgi:hypothetical protein
LGIRQAQVWVGLEHPGQPAGKCLQAGIGDAPARVQQGHGHRRRAHGGQHDGQRALRHVRTHLVARQLRQSQPLQRAQQVGLGVVHGDAAIDGHPDHAPRALFFLFTRERPLERAAGAPREMHDRIVLGQCIDGCRHAPLCQVPGRGGDHEAHQADPARDQAGIGQVAHAQRAIDAFGGQVDQAVAQTDGEIQRRKRLAKFTDARQHDGAPKRTRQVDAQPALHAPRVLAQKVGFGVVDGGQDGVAVGVVALTLGRE